MQVNRSIEQALDEDGGHPLFLTNIKRAPKQRSETFELGQPQLRLISEKPHCSHISATSERESGLFPPSCHLMRSGPETVRTKRVSTAEEQKKAIYSWNFGSGRVEGDKVVVLFRLRLVL